MIQKALQSLADSAAWKQVRDEYISQAIRDIKDVTKEIDTEMDVKPADAYLAKLLAAQAVEKLIHDIDRFANSKSKQEVKKYD